MRCLSFLVFAAVVCSLVALGRAQSIHMSAIYSDSGCTTPMTLPSPYVATYSTWSSVPAAQIGGAILSTPCVTGQAAPVKSANYVCESTGLVVLEWFAATTCLSSGVAYNQTWGVVISTTGQVCLPGQLATSSSNSINFYAKASCSATATSSTGVSPGGASGKNAAPAAVRSATWTAIALFALALLGTLLL